MDLNIERVRDAGILETERVVLRAIKNVDIGDFVLSAAETRDELPVSGSLVAAFWMPDKDIKRGNLVVVYTKNGNEREKLNENGNRSHFFYWGRNEPLWKKGETVPVLSQVEEWSAYEWR